jgi:hypothetical protein
MGIGEKEIMNIKKTKYPMSFRRGSSSVASRTGGCFNLITK